MTFSVSLSEIANCDLREIYEYIAYVLQSPNSAVNQLGRLEKAIYSLDIFPERCSLYKSGKWVGRNLRMMPIDNYIIYYIVDVPSSSVVVTRVLYFRHDAEVELNSLLNDQKGVYCE